MIKISKLADYGIVLMSYVARAGNGEVFTARELAAHAQLPLPTVGKVLKSLSRGGLLVSHRGVKGGYSLSKPADEVSITEMVAAVDGPIALTECSSSAPSLCELEDCCPVRTNWQKINQAVVTALSTLTLADMTCPMSRKLGQREERSFLKIV